MVSDSKNIKIINTVASGGSAVLFKAVQTSLDRIVAVKRLHQHLTDDENFTRRFILEAKAAASLDHENVVHVIDFGLEGDCYQIVMEFVEGESLQEILDRWRPIKYDLALAVAHQILMGLEHAHDKGIVHRDIKPGNVMLTQAGKVKITDFGLAKLTQGNHSYTAANSILGTPLYMSPEQAFGESVDQRSDLFSLGTVLFEMLSGRQPFTSEHYMGVIQNIIHKEIPSVLEFNNDIPDEVGAIVAKALSKDRDDRYASASAFREDIENYLGIVRLKQMADNIKVLLEKSASTTQVLSQEPAPARRKRNVGRSVAVVAAFVVLAGATGVAIWKPESLDKLPPASTPPTSVQQGSAVDQGGYDFNLSDLLEDPAPIKPIVDSAVTQQDDRDAGSAHPPQDAREPQNKPATEEQPRPTVKPAERQGWLSIVARPAAEIYVDGRYQGDTPPPLSLKIKAGMHRIEARHPRHEPYQETLKITAGELSRREITLKKIKGIISLATQDGAEVYLDGQFIGVTPMRKPIECEVGPHMVTLKKPGFLVWSSEVTVEKGKTLPLRITLSPQY